MGCKKLTLNKYKERIIKCTEGFSEVIKIKFCYETSQAFDENDNLLGHAEFDVKKQILTIKNQ
jgi:hypothetical protein